MENVILTSISQEQLMKMIRSSLKNELQPIINSYSNNKNDDDLISIDEVVKLLNISKVTLHKWKKNGLIPFYRISKRIYFKKTEILNSLKQKQFKNK